MATKRGKAKKKNPCWKGYTAMGDDGQIVMKKKGDKMVPACRPIKDGASMNGDNPKYTTSESKTSLKQKRKEDKKKNVSVSKMNRKGKKQVEETGMYNVGEGDKNKMVSRKKAERMKKRGWHENRRI